MEIGESFDVFLVDNFDAEKREETDHGSDLEGDGVLAFDEKLIVIEAIEFIPQAAIADGVHGGEDLGGMLEELRGDVIVLGFFFGEFESDSEHRRAVKSHPSGAIGLGEGLATGQGFGAIEEADII